MPAIIRKDVVYPGGSVDVVDNLDSTASDKALSANMGRELNASTIKGLTKSWYGDATTGAAIYLCNVNTELPNKMYIGSIVMVSSGNNSIDTGTIRMMGNDLYFIPQSTQTGLSIVYNILYV